MGQSVTYAFGNVAVAYKDAANVTVKELVEEVSEQVRNVWPSFVHTHKRVDANNQIILENQDCYVGVSVTLGMASIWLASKNSRHSERYVDQIRDTFMKMFSEYEKVQDFGNGGAEFAKVKKAQIEIVHMPVRF